MAQGVAVMGDAMPTFPSRHVVAGEWCSATRSGAGRVPQPSHGDSIYNCWMFNCGHAGFTIPSPGAVDELVQLRLCGGQEFRVYTCTLQYLFYYV